MTADEKSLNWRAHLGHLEQEHVARYEGAKRSLAVHQKETERLRGIALHCRQNALQRAARATASEAPRPDSDTGENLTAANGGEATIESDEPTQTQDAPS